MTLVRIDVVAAAVVTEVTTRAVAGVRDEVERYRDDLRRLVTAPSELPLTHPDRGIAADADLERLLRLVAALAHLAERVRAIDRGADELRVADDRAVHREVVDLLDEQWHEWVRERTQQVVTWVSGLSTVGDLLELGPERITLLTQRTRWLVRRSTVVLDEVSSDGVRRTVARLDRLVLRRVAIVTAREFDLAWLGRVGSRVGALGTIADVAAGPISAWEQWDADRDDPDLTDTERVLRTTLDGGVRGGAALLVGAAVAAPFTGGASLLVVGGAIVVGAAGGFVLDRALERGLDWLYETEGFARTAAGIDGIGRELRDGWRAAEGWGADALGDLRTLVRELDAAWDDTVGTRTGLGDWAGQRGGWGGERLDDLAGALPWP